MELQVTKQLVNINEVFYDAVTEQPIECDVMLPDYCPDIQKILRCEVVLSLQSQSVSGEICTLDGVATAHLYYLDPDGCLRHAEYKIPYTKTIELRAAPQYPAISVCQTVDYFNCRAVSQRRLDMRGAISMQVRVTGQSEAEVVCGAQGMGVQLRRETVETIALIQPVTRQVRVYEEVELGHGKPAAALVLRAGVVTRPTEQKVVSGKLIAKGEAVVRVLYQCEGETQSIETMEYSLPFSQVIDLPGVEEDCSCHVWFEPCTADVSPKRDNAGENRLLAIELLINATAGGSKRMMLEAAGDSYSTAYECKQTVKQVPFLELVDSVDEVCACKETIDLPCELQNVIDLWCTMGAPTVRVEQDAVTVGGKMAIKLFCTDTAGEIVYAEQMREFSQRIALRHSCETVLFTPQVAADSVSFTISGANQIEVRCGVRIAGELYQQFRRQVVCDLMVDETRKKNRNGNLLYLYYTDGQESVWEIAKRYNSAAEVIRQENGVEELQPGQRMMLLIPVQ